MRRELSIAILGTRGIPNRYGGFEACAEELGIRLEKRGHTVSVYCEATHPVKDRSWEGINRIMMRYPGQHSGTLGQFFYDLACNLDSRKRNFDIILHLGYTSDSIWYPLWSRKSRHLVNMDGMEWKRSKYNLPTRKFLKAAEKMATKRASALIADNQGIADYLKDKYTRPMALIPYGAEIPTDIDPQEIKKFGMKVGQYDLIVARTEPENHIETAIKAKIATNDDIPLLIISNKNTYWEQLKKTYGLDMKIVFHGPEYDKSSLHALRKHARYYIHGDSVGGTNPSLLEAMACSCNILAHNNPFNHAVTGDQALYFNNETELIQLLGKHPADELVTWRKKNIQKIRDIYNWELITDAYEQIFISTLHH